MFYKYKNFLGLHCPLARRELGRVLAILQNRSYDSITHKTVQRPQEHLANTADETWIVFFRAKSYRQIWLVNMKRVDGVKDGLWCVCVGGWGGGGGGRRVHTFSQVFRSSPWIYFRLARDVPPLWSPIACPLLKMLIWFVASRMESLLKKDAMMNWWGSKVESTNSL